MSFVQKKWSFVQIGDLFYLFYDKLYLTKLKGENIMKKFLLKHSSLISAFAVFMTAAATARTCMYIVHEPKLPASAKKLRKF